ncbi:DNA-directed RNA polymerase subunit epsilon [Aerococcus urinaeequi]|uniref:DNA-directed RNA polymerase subunit epsilon n=1 Tax=Aerococcus urinaeequi TaxID=51665 RepID=UPI0039BCB66B
MIFKVTYQDSLAEVPRRESTHTMYVQAETKREVRAQLENETPYLVEFIQPLEGAHLEYEQQNPDFKVVELSN